MPSDDESRGKQQVIRSSDPNWFEDMAQAYKDHSDVNFVDDANTGFNPSTETLFKAGIRIGLSTEQWTIALACFGVGSVGCLLILTAVLDPEPTSKLALLIGAGAILAVGGGFSGIYMLTNLKPPNVKLGSGSVEIRWT